MARAPWEFLRVINDERRGNLGRRTAKARPVQSVRQMKDPNRFRDCPLETPRWNVHKYLIGRDGHIARGFAGDIEPMDDRVIDAT
jgi:glutathione peroxidase-family protein